MSLVFNLNSLLFIQVLLLVPGEFESPKETLLAWFLLLQLELMGLGSRVGGGDEDSDDEEEDEEEEEDEDVILRLRCVCWLESSISRKVHWMFCPYSSLSLSLSLLVSCYFFSLLTRHSVGWVEGWITRFLVQFVEKSSYLYTHTKRCVSQTNSRGRNKG